VPFYEVGKTIASFLLGPPPISHPSTRHPFDFTVKFFLPRGTWATFSVPFCAVVGRSLEFSLTHPAALVDAASFFLFSSFERCRTLLPQKARHAWYPRALHLGLLSDTSAFFLSVSPFSNEFQTTTLPLLADPQESFLFYHVSKR